MSRHRSPSVSPGESDLFADLPAAPADPTSPLGLPHPRVSASGPIPVTPAPTWDQGRDWRPWSPPAPSADSAPPAFAPGPGTGQFHRAPEWTSFSDFQQGRASTPPGVDVASPPTDALPTLGSPVTEVIPVPGSPATEPTDEAEAPGAAAGPRALDEPEMLDELDLDDDEPRHTGDPGGSDVHDDQAPTALVAKPAADTDSDSLATAVVAQPGRGAHRLRKDAGAARSWRRPWMIALAVGVVVALGVLLGLTGASKPIIHAAQSLWSQQNQPGQGDADAGVPALTPAPLPTPAAPTAEAPAPEPSAPAKASTRPSAGDSATPTKKPAASDSAASQAAKPTKAPVAAATGQEKLVHIWLTGYSFQDNTPPGSAEVSHPIVHQRAGGTGTYADPITVAVPGQGSGIWKAGSRFYLPTVRRYVIVEDTGASEPPSGQDGHLDMWVDGEGGSKSASDRCMDKITGTGVPAIYNPAPGKPVMPGPITSNGICRIPG